MFDKIGGRKFICLLVLILTGVLVDIFGPKGISDNLLNLLMTLGGFYMAGNVAGGLIKGKNKEQEELIPHNEEVFKEELQEPMSDEDRIKTLEAQLGQVVNSLNTHNEALAAITQKLGV